MKIVEIRSVSNEVFAAINGLLPQLSTSAPQLSKSDLEEIIASESSHLLMAEDEGTYIGSLTLVTFKIPTGIRAWIEDVVVSEAARGKGIGRLLSEHALSLAKTKGAKTVDLTSRPSRQAANALYEKVGFEIRETNVYRYEIT
jgi:ribosomal protein S18 acetylase RimI-like enzyme